MDQATQLRNIIKMREQPKISARVITITSGKGGTGKSTVTLNLALKLSQQGKRVVILDADFGLANIEVMLGIRPNYSLADLIYKGKSLKDIIVPGPEGIGFISGGSGIQELVNMTKDQIVALAQSLYELDDLADVVLVDTGAGINDSVLEFIEASAEVLLVVTPEPTSITDAYALLKTLNKKTDFLAKSREIRVVSNQVSTIMEGKEIFDKLNVVVKQFLDLKIEFLGVIPKDRSLYQSVIRQSPVVLSYPNAVSSRAFGELAWMLAEQTVVGQTGNRGIVKLLKNMVQLKFSKESVGGENR